MVQPCAKKFGGGGGDRQRSHLNYIKITTQQLQRLTSDEFGIHHEAAHAHGAAVGTRGARRHRWAIGGLELPITITKRGRPPRSRRRHRSRAPPELGARRARPSSGTAPCAPPSQSRSHALGCASDGCARSACHRRCARLRCHHSRMLQTALQTPLMTRSSRAGGQTIVSVARG